MGWYCGQFQFFSPLTRDGGQLRRARVVVRVAAKERGDSGFRVLTAADIAKSLGRRAAALPRAYSSALVG